MSEPRDATPQLACATCSLWAGRDPDTGEARAKARCRANPPLASIGAEALWPVTKADDWCGAHPALAEGPQVNEATFGITVDIEPCEGCGAPPLAMHEPECPRAVTA